MMAKRGSLRLSGAKDDFGIEYTYGWRGQHAGRRNQVRFDNFIEEISPFNTEHSQKWENPLVEDGMSVIQALGALKIGDQADEQQLEFDARKEEKFCDLPRTDYVEEAKHELMNLISERISALPVPLYDMDVQDVSYVFNLIKATKGNFDSLDEMMPKKMECPS